MCKFLSNLCPFLKSKSERDLEPESERDLEPEREQDLEPKFERVVVVKKRTEKKETYGYFWEANKIFSKLKKIKSYECEDYEKKGVFVRILKDCSSEKFKEIEEKKLIFGDALFSTIEEGSAGEVENIPNWFPPGTRESAIGFLKYTKYCLDYIYATESGKEILKYLLEQKKSTIIEPGIENKCFGSQPCELATLFQKSHIIKGRKKVINLVNEKYNVNETNSDKVYEKLLNDIKKMPLYSLYEEQKTPYSKPGYLQECDFITEESLKKFIEKSIPIYTSDECDEAGIIKNNFINNAMIILLYDSDKRIGCPTTKHKDIPQRVQFLVYKNKDLKAEQKPAAIALAHELIHAYNNKKRISPGGEHQFHNTLSELHCVGIGPWDASRKNSECMPPKYSENKIRKQWNDGIDIENCPDDARKYFDSNKKNLKLKNIKRNVYTILSKKNKKLRMYGQV